MFTFVVHWALEAEWTWFVKHTPLHKKHSNNINILIPVVKDPRDTSLNISATEDSASVY